MGGLCVGLCCVCVVWVCGCELVSFSSYILHQKKIWLNSQFWFHFHKKKLFACYEIHLFFIPSLNRYYIIHTTFCFHCRPPIANFYGLSRLWYPTVVTAASILIGILASALIGESVLLIFSLHDKIRLRSKCQTKVSKHLRHTSLLMMKVRKDIEWNPRPKITVRHYVHYLDSDLPHCTAYKFSSTHNNRSTHANIYYSGFKAECKSTPSFSFSLRKKYRKLKTKGKTKLN